MMMLTSAVTTSVIINVTTIMIATATPVGSSSSDSLAVHEATMLKAKPLQYFAVTYVPCNFVINKCITMYVATYTYNIINVTF